MPRSAILLAMLVSLAIGCAKPSRLEPRFVAVHNALGAMGMAHTGNISSGSLSEGIDAKLQVELRAGECYTFIALGSGGVEDIDIRIVDHRGEEIGRDVTHDRQAAARACAETSGAHTAVVTMRKGSGGYLVTFWSGSAGSGSGGRMLAGGGGGEGTCQAPIQLTLGEPVTGDTTGGGQVMQGPCAQGASPERVYRIELDARAQLSVTLQASFDASLYIVSACGDSGSVLDCNDDAEDANHSRLDTILDAGVYFVVVDGYGTASGSYELSANVTPRRPLREVCADAASLDVGQPATGSTQGATDYFQATCADGARMPDRVYQLDVPQRSRLRVRQRTDHDGALYVRTDCTDATTEVACNDDFTGTQRSLVTAMVDPGRYFVYADGFGNGSQLSVGNYSLTAELAPAAGGGAAADTCATAAGLASGPTEVDTFEADDDLAGSCGGEGGPDVVYTFEVRSRSRVRVKVIESEFEGAMYLRRRCDDASSEVACTAIPLSVPRATETVLEATVAPGSYTLVFDGARPAAFGALKAELDIRDLVELERACRSAPLLRPGRTINDTTNGRSDEFQASCAEGARSGDRVYRVQLSRRSTVRVDMTGDYDGALHLRRDCADASTELQCNDDHGSDNRHSRVEATLDRGTYYVIVDGFREGNEGSFSLEAHVTNP